MAELAHYLKVQFGLPPEEPTDAQLKLIVADIQAFAAKQGREPNVEETGEIVKARCPGFQKWKYAADVNLELRRQIALLAAQSKK